MENKYFIPPKIRQAMTYDPILGVCVVFKGKYDNKWFSTNFSHSEYAYERLSTLILSGKYSDFEHDYVIINSLGEVCSSNSDVEVFKDDLGYIHIDNKYIVKVYDNDKFYRYVGGKDKKEINNKIEEYKNKNKRKKL